MADTFWVICRGCERVLPFGKRCEACASRATWRAVIVRGMPDVVRLLAHLAAIAIAMAAATLLLQLRLTGAGVAPPVLHAVMPASLVSMAMAALCAMLAGLAMIASKSNWAFSLMRLGTGLAVVAAALAGVVFLL